MRKVLLIPLAVVLSGWAMRYAIDFDVYRDTAEAVFFHGQVPYGEGPGLDWPMWYRYPPLLLLPFALFALLPAKIGAFVWAIGKCGAAVGLISNLVARLGGVWEVERWLPAAAIAAPYWVMELRYGNVQFYIFLLTAWGLLWARKRPRLAGGLLGSAIAIKVWPLFFAPMLWLKGARQAVAISLLVAASLTMVPSTVFGWSTNISWLGEWYTQETAISANAGAMWFPSQSFHGVAHRHLSAIDYSAMPDPNYRNIEWADLSPQNVRWLWLVVATVCCLAFFAGAWRSEGRQDLEWAALGFCVLTLFQPFSQKQITLTILMWPAIVASARATGWARVMLISAGFIALYPLLLPARLQRLLLVFGFDALVVVLLAATLIHSVLRAKLPQACTWDLDATATGAGDAP